MTKVTGLRPFYKMNKYIVDIDYSKYVFDEGEAALSFAEVAMKHIKDRKTEVIIIIEEEEAEDGR